MVNGVQSCELDLTVPKATVINLGSRITSMYSFDQTTEQVLNSEETPNHFKMLKASEFSLVEFKQSFDLIVD